MARTALLAQNDNLVIDSIKQNVGRSVFDLSHSTTFPIDVDGAILPICAIECVPSDSFQISCECLLRQLSPLKVPVMTNLRLNTAFYFCDNRLAWKKWDRFIEGGRSGNEVYSLPRVCNHSNRTYPNSKPDYGLLIDYGKTVKANEGEFTRNVNINYKNTLHTYFGISQGLVEDSNHEIDIDTLPDSYKTNKELPLAFPFFDYQIICRDDYTDVDRLKEQKDSLTAFYNFDDTFSDWNYENLFPVDEDEIKLNDGVQFMSGFQTGDDSNTNPKGIILDKVRYHNVRDDYFTTSKKAPMRGNEPSINLTSTSTSINFEDAITEGNKNLYALLGVDNAGKLGFATRGIPSGTTPSSTTNIGIFYDSMDSDSATIPGSYEIGEESRTAYMKSENTAPNSIKLLDVLNQAKINVSIDSQVTAQELRLLSQLTVWQELNMLHKPYYNDFLNAHFTGVRVGDSLTEKPQYIGGTSQIIHINEIQQTSASTETSALGTVGATAHSLENNYVGQFYCNSYGWIIGVAYIQVDMLYNPAMPRSFSRQTKEDYYFPEFANLSMQATLNKELFYSNDDEWNNTPWGYTGAFDELRSIPNHVAGDLLNNNYLDLKSWVLRREFANDNLPSMSTEFLSLKDNVDKTAWQVPLMPAFMLQAANYIKAVRPMPYVAIPKAL